MQNLEREKTLSKLFLIGPAVVSILVVTSSVTDPVNVTKFFALGGLAGALLALTLGKDLRLLWKSSRGALLFSALFVISSLNSLVHSDSPITQQVYGIYGRNNGILLYLFLTILFISSASITRTETIEKFIWALVIVGVTNLIYCGWVIAFGDFLGWSNPYGNILGTFGNPNFIGAFFGIFSSVLLSYVIHFRKNTRYLILGFCSYALTAFEIFNSSAIQGRVLLVFGFVLNGFFYLRNRTNSKLLSIGYLGFSGVFGILGVLGTLQIGPLTKFVYKESVSLRGEYWYAGFKMGVTHLWSGVGFDSYGDWYRTLRRSSALVRPGVDTVSNSSHNVFLDIFAFGGIPSILSYLGMFCLVIISARRYFRHTRKFDPLFTSLLGAWLCYQLQSLISINQIGLAIWGWLLSGAIIAYVRIKLNQNSNLVKSLTNRTKSLGRNSEVFSPQLRAGVGIVIGLLLAVPPLSSDIKLRTAQESRSADQLEATLKSGYLNPPNTNKYLTTIQTFEQSNMTKTSHKIALAAVEFNPTNFDVWKFLYLLKDSTDTEKQESIRVMKSRDPLNPNILESNK